MMRFLIYCVIAIVALADVPARPEWSNQEIDLLERALGR